MASKVDFRFEIKKLVRLTTNIEALPISDLKKLEIVAFDSSGMSVQFPKKVLRVGQLFILEGLLLGPATSNSVRMTVKVKKAHELLGGKSKIDFHFHQFDKDLWQEFLAKQKLKQIKIDKMLRMVQGNDD